MVTPGLPSDLWRHIYHLKKSDKEKSALWNRVINHFQEKQICLLFYYFCESKLSYRCFWDLSRSDKFILFGITWFYHPSKENCAICPDCSQRSVNSGNMNMKYNLLFNLEEVRVSSEADSFLFFFFSLF